MNHLHSRDPAPALEKELKHIAIAPKSALRERYIQLFRREPPKAFGPDLLRRSVAQKLQENAYGGLSKPAQRELNRLVRLMMARPDARLRMPRQAKTGTELVRDFKGKSYRVLIVQDGFSYDGKIYCSLSEIARLITGTRWNGPRFFGLRRQIDERPPAQPKALKREPGLRKPSIGDPGSIQSPLPPRARSQTATARPAGSDLNRPARPAFKRAQAAHGL